MNLIWQRSYDSLRQHIVTLDALEIREDRFKHVALAQQKVIARASLKRYPRLKVEARMNDIQTNEALLPI